MCHKGSNMKIAYLLLETVGQIYYHWLQKKKWVLVIAKLQNSLMLQLLIPIHLKTVTSYGKTKICSCPFLWYGFCYTKTLIMILSSYLLPSERKSLSQWCKCMWKSFSRVPSIFLYSKFKRELACHLKYFSDWIAKSSMYK